MSSMQSEPAPVLAAFRTLYDNHPEWRPTLRSHVLRANGEPACGIAGGLHGEIWVNAHASESAEEVAEEVAESARCQRPGCKERWPAPVYKRSAQGLRSANNGVYGVLWHRI